MVTNPFIIKNTIPSHLTMSSAMLRTTFTKTAAFRPLRATFTTTARAMADGDVGAPSKYGGGDAFQKREKANEDYAIRQREKEKLLELKQQLHEQQAHLKRLSDHMFVPRTLRFLRSHANKGHSDDITKNQGGEQN
ncbi:ATPase inhibitor, IATP, mitochondria [Paramyrothecium foliicola]|nr:ATPase inhibitor, IATP, mitochondria [Paramyrothecium foliicola]